MNRFQSLAYVLKIANCRTLNESTTSLVLCLTNNISKIPNRRCSSEVTSTKEIKKPTAIEHVEEPDLSDRGSVIKGRFNFAMYADKSPIIQKYIDLGVNLFQLEKNPEAAKYLLTLPSQKLNNYLLFLNDNGVTGSKLGEFITKNPLIFKEDLDDLQVRINYLKSKKFDEKMITTIITRNPKWLSTPVQKIDNRLGFIQRTFHLKGDQIREMITKAPSLATISKDRIEVNVFTLKEEMGLEGYNLKKTIVAEPRLLRLDPYDLVLTYEYLTNKMKVSRILILNQPKILTYRKFIIQQRHKFLESLGRAQYCHLLPGYVDLLSLVETSDSEFCERVAKTSEQLYKDFLKTF